MLTNTIKVIVQKRVVGGLCQVVYDPEFKGYYMTINNYPVYGNVATDTADIWMKKFDELQEIPEIKVNNVISFFYSGNGNELLKHETVTAENLQGIYNSIDNGYIELLTVTE